MKLTQGMKQTPRWGTLIKQKRRRLKETQAEFGARFGVTYVAVSLWESNKREAPYSVTWWLYKELLGKMGKK